MSRPLHRLPPSRSPRSRWSSSIHFGRGPSGGRLLPPAAIIAVYYGSTLAFLASLASGPLAAYFLFPPKFSLYIANPVHIAELGFFMLLALIASKAGAVVAHDVGRKKSILYGPRPSRRPSGTPYGSSTMPRLSVPAPFLIRSYRFQWPADLLTSWAFEMEALILGWYVLVETGSVLLLTVFGALGYGGTLLAPMLGVASDRIGIGSCLPACGRSMPPWRPRCSCWRAPAR